MPKRKGFIPACSLSLRKHLLYHGQKISEMYGRGLGLDILAKDKEGQVFCFEVERSKERATHERARYIGGLVDSRFLLCQLMEDRITEEKIEMGKDEIRLGDLTLEPFTRSFKLPLPVVQELVRTQSVSA